MIASREDQRLERDSQNWSSLHQPIWALFFGRVFWMAFICVGLFLLMMVISLSGESPFIHSHLPPILLIALAVAFFVGIVASIAYQDSNSLRFHFTRIGVRSATGHFRSKSNDKPAEVLPTDNGLKQTVANRPEHDDSPSENQLKGSNQ
jgi:hypothetical protein